ncbi:hypothetical protein DH2020_034075 [Rehmannia glutinosa]|uniref:Peptidase M3A/M3B catalytic domain-containing protein n=1 Tax=Rehmannia glutinosa TaxID=99300 RepID=A0ABR0VDR7_REHGL
MLRALIRTPAAYFSYGRRFVHSSTAPLIKGTGLYGFDHLKTPKGFQRMVDDAIERSNELVNHIAGMPSAPEIIKAMDEISDTYLNSNPSLYHAIIRAEQNHHMLTEEAARAAHHLRIDLEKGGIHLSPEKLDRVNRLNIDILQLCREFNENIISDPGHVDIFPASRIPKKLHHLTKPIYRASSLASKRSTGLDSNLKERGLRVMTEPNTLCSILQLTPDAEVRRLAYIRGNSAPRANLVVLDKLLSARHEFSEIMGYKSYAEFALKENMASSPEVVLSFLRDMSEMVRPKAEEEFKKILDFKRAETGQSVKGLEPWDEPYFTRMMKSSAHNLDFSVVASYFSLPQCIEGLKVLAGSLFDVKFREIPLGPGESWHPDVLKLSLHHPDEGDLGYLYLDLKSRKDKHPICAHFAIKGGRKISDTEYYAWDYRVLRTFAKHYSTGDPIPENLVKSLQGAKNMFAATELQRQVFYALIDQALHASQPSSVEDTISIVADLKREHTSWKHVEGTHWHTRFSHLVTYGAGYYSYLYAKCFAATIWKKMFQEDPLSLAAGSALRSKFLQHGGAKDPTIILNDLVGNRVVRNQNGGIIPGITSLGEEMKLFDES